MSRSLTDFKTRLRAELDTLPSVVMLVLFAAAFALLIVPHVLIYSCLAQHGAVIAVPLLFYFGILIAGFFAFDQRRAPFSICYALLWGAVAAWPVWVVAGFVGAMLR